MTEVHFDNHLMKHPFQKHKPIIPVLLSALGLNQVFTTAVSNIMMKAGFIQLIFVNLPESYQLLQAF